MKFHIVTLGCPKNEVDSEGIEVLLTEAGHSPAERTGEADLVIVNTCGFIDAAKQESLGSLRTLAAEKKPGSYLVAAGCLAQRDGGKLMEQVAGIDAVIGCRSWPDITRVVEAIQEQSADGRRSTVIGHQSCVLSPASSTQNSEPRTQNFTQHSGLSTQDPTQDSGLSSQDLTLTSPHSSGPVFLSTDLQLPAVPRKPRPGSAYVKISDGCDASCAFCAIPSIKGPYESKPRAAILEEVRQLASGGTREVVLVGQDSTAYGLDLVEKDGLATLLREMAAVAPGLPWIRVLYLYPQRISPELLRAMAELPQVCKYVDIPLQHTHPAVLRRMKRPKGDVAELVAAIREAIPAVAIRTTFIVGFPGETAAEHSHLLHSIEKLRLDHVGVFAYSPQEGTPAYSMPNQVPEHTKERRRREAMEVAQRVSLRQNRKLVGHELDVLVEGVENVDDGGREPMTVGRSYRDAPEVDGLVLFSGRAAPGEIVQVRITGAMEYDLVGDLVKHGH